jgi:hypothetical protein
MTFASNGTVLHYAAYQMELDLFRAVFIQKVGNACAVVDRYGMTALYACGRSRES